jgi:hypothetical protein
MTLMKKLICIAAALPFVIAGFAPNAMARGDKEEVCHILAANDIVYNFVNSGNDLHFGQVRNISSKAVNAHVAHGDATLFFEPPSSTGPINVFREAGVKLPAADCYVLRTPEGDQVAPAP